MKKRILSLILTLCVLAAMAAVLSVTAFAADTLTYKAPERDVTYTYDKDTNTLTITGTADVLDDDVKAAKAAFESAGVSFLPVSLVIGEGIENFYTTQFYSCTSLQSVTVCGNTSLTFCAFNGCTSLTSVTFLSDARVGDKVFKDCTGLTSIVIPGKATIARSAFSGCTNLQSITVGGDVKLGSSAFFSCNSLKNAYFFGGVSYVGEDPFKNSSHALNVYIGTATAKTDYESKFTNRNVTVIPMTGTCGASATDNVTWRLSADGTLTISGTGAMADYTNDDQPWNAIKSMVKSVRIEDGVTKIGANAFEGCSISTIYGYTGTVAETYATGNNISFVPLSGTCGATGNEANVTWKLSADGTLTISGSGKMADYTYLGGQPWAGFKDMIKKIVIEDGVTGIGDYAFKECSNLESMKFKGDAQNIGYGAFMSCDSLTSLVISADVGIIGEYAFAYNEKMTEITFMGDVESIARNAFRWCEAVTKLTFNGNIGSIDEYAFEYCKALTEIRFMGNVGSIGYEAFHDCEELTTIFFAGDVGNIGDYAFDYDEKLANVYCFGNVTYVDEDAFNGCYNIFNLYCYTDNFVLRSAQTENGKIYIPLDGTDGDITWKLSADGTLTISGNGTLTPDSNWTTFVNNGLIKSVVIDGTVNYTSIGLTPKYTVTFNDGDTLIATNLILTDNMTATQPATPTKDGYTFLGWYEKDTNNELKNTAFDFANTEITSDVTLYAKWNCLHTGDTEVHNEKSATCTEDGYTGDTWCLGCGDKISDGTVIPATGHKDENNDHCCDACEEQITVCVDNNGDHKCDICDKRITMDGTFNITVKDKNGNPIEEGVFVQVINEKWDKSTSTYVRKGYELASHIGNGVYTVTFDDVWTNLSERFYVIVTSYAGTTQGPAEVATLSGTTANVYPYKYGETTVDYRYCVITDDYPDSEIYNFTAEFEYTLNGYDVTFDANGGSAVATVNTFFGKTLDLNAYTTARDGYTFLGWSQDGVTVIQKIENIQSDVRLVALWVDSENPVISGVENGKTYCSAQTITLSDNEGVNGLTVTVNGNTVQPNTDGQLTLSPAKGEQNVVVTDKAGNSASVTVTVNDGHTGGTANCHEKAVCEICNQSYGELNPDNHTGGTEVRGAYASTCESDGYTGNTWCLGCETIVKYGTVIPAHGHSFAIADAGDGLHHISICTNNCGLVITAEHIHINGKCIACGHTVEIDDSEILEEEEVIVDVPVESQTEETDTDDTAEESPETGVTVSLISLTLAALATVIGKRV